MSSLFFIKSPICEILNDAYDIIYGATWIYLNIIRCELFCI